MSESRGSGRRPAHVAGEPLQLPLIAPAGTAPVVQAAPTAAAQIPTCARWAFPKEAIDGEVIEIDPLRKLVQTYRFLFTEEQKAEGFTRVT